MKFRFASLNDNSLTSIKSFESDSGTVLLALKPDNFQPAALSADQIEKLKTLESELGVVLLAFQPQ